jgi:hypothetical protein
MVTKFLARCKPSQSSEEAVPALPVCLVDPLWEQCAALLPARPVVPVEGLRVSAEALASENPRALDLDVRRMIDTSVLDRIRQSGFIDALYR